MGTPVDETAVADTGPPMHVAEVGCERVLALFARVSITEEVRAELTRHAVYERTREALGERLAEETVLPEERAAQDRLLGASALHITDLSVAALAARVAPDVVLTDDSALRRALEGQGHVVTGSIGVLVRAFRLGSLPREALHLALEGLLDGSTLYLSQGLRARVRRMLDALAAGRSP